jgi:aryl-alcohol dehydrogenase (NADP+)
VAVIPYNPLAGGLLTGKHDRTAPPDEGTRFTLGLASGLYQQRYWHERAFDTVDSLRPVADEAGMSMATMAVAWVLANPAVTSAIVGASRPGQLADSLAAVDKPMDADLKARLDDLTAEWRRGDADR